MSAGSFMERTTREGEGGGEGVGAYSRLGALSNKYRALF